MANFYLTINPYSLLPDYLNVASGRLAGVPQNPACSSP